MAATARTANHSRFYKKNAREQLIRRQMTMIFVVMCAIVAAIVISMTFINTHRVTASNVYEEQTYYKSVQVTSGDTLWDIADEYMGHSYADKNDFIDEVMEINHLYSEKLTAGSYILVPYTVLAESK